VQRDDRLVGQHERLAPDAYGLVVPDVKPDTDR
jgi:hypothetical protein